MQDGWRNLGVLVWASLEVGASLHHKTAWAKWRVRYTCVAWWNVLSHRSKADLLKTSHVLICQCYKWEQTKSNSPIPTPLCFIFHSLLAQGLWGPLLHATVGDQGKETAYIFSSYLRKSFHTLMWLPGKLPLKKYLHDETFKLKKRWGDDQSWEFPHNPPSWSTGVPVWCQQNRQEIKT